MSGAGALDSRGIGLARSWSFGPKACCVPPTIASTWSTAASALGYGANWLTGWFEFDRDVLDGFGLKADEKLAGFIHIGTPAKPAEDRPRPALSDIVTRF